jgi:TfoX/Sxy family transcriptional regulator of competence genes
MWPTWISERSRLEMAFDELLGDRVRTALSDRDDVIERRMFGGLVFMVAGNMCVGISGDDLMVRLGPDVEAEALAQPHARPMDFTGRPMKGFVNVSSAGIETDDMLSDWVARGVAYATTNPANAGKRSKRTKPRR